MSASAPSSSRAAEFTALENAIVDHTFVLSPSYAVFLGLHRYDGLLPDLSRPATDAWAEEATRLLERLAKIPSEELPEARRLDHRLLGLLLESSLYDLRESRDYDRNPMAIIGAFTLTPYMVREYAPIAERVDAMERLLRDVPRCITRGESRLDERVPEPFLKLALAMAGGLPQHFLEAEELAGRTSPTLAARVREARETAEKALQAFVERLKSERLPKATGDFALGPEKFQRLLWVREGIRTPYGEILASGTADLQRNQQRLDEIARSHGTTVAELLERVYRNHTTAANLVPQAAKFVEETRAFVADRDLATIPTPSVCRVEETPSYSRALYTASMNPPGPYDVEGDEGIYFITPVDPAWAPERQEEWLRSLNDPMLRNITVHEVYPGHYLQFLHHRRGAATTARKVFLSAAFTEGWAHYAEQLAIEAGLGTGTPDAEVAQIHDALLRDCRLLSSIGLHTAGWTVEDSTKLFEREAHFERLPAEREAIRGTFNPEYFCYTLGKLAILDVRRKLLDASFGGSLKQFHDRLLGFGCPPVGVLEELMSPPPAGPAPG